MEFEKSKMIHCENCSKEILEELLSAHKEKCLSNIITSSTTIPTTNSAENRINNFNHQNFIKRYDEMKESLKAIDNLLRNPSANKSEKREESMRRLLSNRENSENSIEKKLISNLNRINYDIGNQQSINNINERKDKENKFEYYYNYPYGNKISQNQQNNTDGNIGEIIRMPNLQTVNLNDANANNQNDNDIMSTFSKDENLNRNIEGDLNLKNYPKLCLKDLENRNLENMEYKEQNLQNGNKQKENNKNIPAENLELIKSNSPQNDLTNLNFMNSCSAVVMDINNNQFNRNFGIEDNFNINEFHIKNLIQNEISKISHDNFNDDNYQISDNEEENFEIKRKKYNNMNVNSQIQNLQESHLKNKMIINIDNNALFSGEKSERTNQDNKKLKIFSHTPNNIVNENHKEPYLSKEENKLLEDIEELNSLTNPIREIESDIQLYKNISNVKTNKFEKKPSEKTKISNNLQQTNSIQQATSKDKINYQTKLNKLNFNSTRDEISVYNMNNSVERVEQSMKIPDENFLTRIEEKNQEKYQEAIKIAEEIAKIESNLKLDQRLLHEKWQIRKNSFKEVSDLINLLYEVKEANEFEKQETLDTFFHWLKYFISDTNVVALTEGLNTFYVFIQHCNMDQKNKALMEFFDELEKLVLNNKPSILDLCMKITMNAINTKKLTNFSINEIIRKLNTPSIKLLMFVSRIIDELLENKNSYVSEHYLKILFEKAIFNYNSKNLNKQLERKRIYGKIISLFFEKINDQLETIKMNINCSSEDWEQLEKLLGKLNKEKKENKNSNLFITLYEPIKETNRNKEFEGIQGNSYSNVHRNENKIDNRHNNTDNSKHIDARNYGSNNNLNTEVVDLFNILNNEFFEIPYITTLKTKKEILENVNKKLSDFVAIKDREYKEILNIINYTIDDTNVLVNLEGIKFLKNICKLSKNTANLTKIKSLLVSCYEKFKDKKTNVKIELFDLFNVIIINNIFPFEQFIMFKLQNVSSQKNPIVKQNLLEYIKELFSISDKVGNFKSEDNSNKKFKTESSYDRSIRAKSKDFRVNSENEGSSKNLNLVNPDESKSLREILSQNFCTKTVIQFTRPLADIIKDDSQSQVKDLSVEILLFVKNILYQEGDKSLIEKYENIIASLPNFRVNMINTGRTKGFAENQNSDKEYKANLNRIKSNLSFANRIKSQQRDIGRADTVASLSKEKNQNVEFKNKLNKKTEIFGKDDKNDSESKVSENDGEKKLKKYASKKIVDTNKLKTGKKKEISDDDSLEKGNYNTKSSVKNSVKSPNIKVLKKNVPVENPENLIGKLDKKNTKKRLNHEDIEQNEKYKKIKVKEKEEKNNKDKSQNKIINNKKLQHKESAKGKINNSTKSSMNNSEIYQKTEENHKQLKKAQKKNNLPAKKLDNETSNLTDSNMPSTNRNNKSVLEKKMETAIEYISNLNEDHIFEYTKSVIRDFLIFIKKVTSSNNEKEDLDCHFQVILKILDSIFNQMELLGNKLEFETLNGFINEEIFIQTFKIIIVAPCFLEDIDFHLLPFIRKIRKIIDNDLKFFEIYFEILNKFICFEKGSSFLQDINPKNTFIVFYDFFLLEEHPFEKQILIKFEPYIIKNVFFTEEEKQKYIKEFRQTIKVFEITQKNFDLPKNELEDEDNSFVKLGEIKIENKIEIQKNQSSKKIQQFSENNQINPYDEQQNLNYEDEEEKPKDDFLEDYEDSRKKYLNEEKQIIEIQSKSSEKFQNKKNNQNLSPQNIEPDQSDEDLIMNNYDFFNKQRQIIIKNEKSENLNNNSLKNNHDTFSKEKEKDIFLSASIDKDISKIKDSIKEKCRKLDMNIKRINNKIDGEITQKSQDNPNLMTNATSNSNTSNSNFNENQLFARINEMKNKNIYVPSQDISEFHNSNLYKPKRNLEDLEEIETNEVENCNSNYNNPNKMNNFFNSNNNNGYPQNDLNIIKKLQDMNNIYGSEDKNLKNNGNFSVKQNLNKNSVNLDEIKKLILKIPVIILDDCVSEVSHYVMLENFFMKITSDIKLEFAHFLSNSINNISLIKTSSFNCFLQLLEFLLTLLIFEMKNNQKTPIDLNSKNVILKLQETIETILKHKSHTEIFKLLIFLLRKYLPEDFNIIIEKDNLIYLKTISYLLKISIENKIKLQANLNTIEILSEINELFIMHSPTNLSEIVPNLEDLDKVYKLLRLLTDEIIKGNQNLALARAFLENSKKSESKKYCGIFLQYLESIISNSS